MLRTLIASCAAAALLCAAGAAQSAIVTYNATLNGPNEGNASPGVGFATFAFDDVANTVQIDAWFSGLTAPTTASHVHCCTAVPGTGTAGVATQVPNFSLFPLGVTSGTFSQLFDLSAASTYNPAFVTANGGTIPTAEAALLNGVVAGRAYLNIHTSAFPGGEIRGFLAPVPETETWALMILGFGLAGATLRRRRSALAFA
ncbi:MAG: CHRD domain-containing protein [Phenylobacterium sp.]